MATVTALRTDLRRLIENFIRENSLKAGEKLVTSSLAREFRVSRTPVEAALGALAAEGIVERRSAGGYTLVRTPAAAPPEHDGDSDDTAALMIEIARLRRSGELASETSTREIVRLTGQPLAVVQRTLNRLEELGSIERKMGYGWAFANLADAATRAESNRFRQIGREPRPDCSSRVSGLTSIGRRISAPQHEKILQETWAPHSSPVRFFEMNAAFHEGLAVASGNRFVLDCIRRQNQVRRLFNYDWLYGFDRVVQNSREHLAMLDCLQAGDREMASLLMRRHLQGAQKARRRRLARLTLAAGLRSNGIFRLLCQLLQPPKGRERSLAED